MSIVTIDLDEEKNNVKVKEKKVDDLVKDIEELWHVIKDLERRIKLLESKNSDGWCNK